MKFGFLLFTLIFSSFSLNASELVFESNRDDFLVKNILSEVKNDLSTKFQASLPKKIKVIFKNINNKALEKINCAENVTVGRAYFGVIEVDNVFLKEMSKGDRALVGCVHSTVKNYLKATIAHELAHLYDNKEKVSKDPVFLNIAGWVSKGLLIHRRKNLNQNDERSPDHYEFKNQAETFAVNLEHFLYDPNYKCRKPLYYDFYSQELNLSPNADSTCEATQKVPSFNADNIRELKDFKIENLYQVHYLLAGKGDAAMSRFGHSMFRLVMCAPGKEKGPSCMNDVKYHLVLSFRASIAGGLVNSLDGMTGKYPSELYVTPFYKVIEEYTKGELREVSSLPIKFSEIQLERFLNRTKEIVWGYSGKYYFLTNNCATESLNLIRVAAGEVNKIQTVNINTPRGIFNYLVKTQMGNSSVLENKKEAQNKGFYYPSAADKVKSSMTFLNINEKDLRAFIKKNNVLKRRAIYLEAIKNSNERKKATANALRIEDLVYEHNKLELQAMLMKAAYDEKSDHYAKLSTFRDGLEAESTTEKNIQKINNDEKSYGIPLKKEIVDSNKSSNDKKNSDQIEKVKDIITEIYKNEVTNIEKIGETKIELKKILVEDLK